MSPEVHGLGLGFRGLGFQGFGFRVKGLCFGLGSRAPQGKEHGARALGWAVGLSDALAKFCPKPSTLAAEPQTLNPRPKYLCPGTLKVHVNHYYILRPQSPCIGSTLRPKYSLFRYMDPEG